MKRGLDLTVLINLVFSFCFHFRYILHDFKVKNRKIYKKKKLFVYERTRRFKIELNNNWSAQLDACQSALRRVNICTGQ